MAKLVSCPNCNRFLFKADEFTTMNLSMKCKKCGKLITFHGESRRVTVGEVPKRNTASGVRFV